MRQRTRVLYDPDNELVQQFVEASAQPLTREQRHELELRRPWLELTSPGLLAVLDKVSWRSVRAARRVSRLRKDLTFVYEEARAMGIFP